MYIVTVAAGDERAGCLVGFTTQSSIEPPRFLVCLSDKNRTFRVARRAELLIVHLVPDVDKFERCEWRPGPGGAPVLAACSNWFAGRILERWPAGDHWPTFSIRSRRAAIRTRGRSSSTGRGPWSRGTTRDDEARAHEMRHQRITTC